MASIIEKMRKNKLRWFEYVMRREESEARSSVMKINVRGNRAIGRPKRQLDTIENETRTTSVCEVEDWVKQKCTRELIPNSWDKN